MDEAYKDRAEELLQALHYADYSAAMRLLRSLNTMEAEQAALYAGFSTISRKAEDIYKACLDIALKLRAIIDMDAAQTVFQDY